MVQPARRQRNADTVAHKHLNRFARRFAKRQAWCGIVMSPRTASRFERIHGSNSAAD